MLVHRYLIAPYAERVEMRILPMTYVPKSTKLILEAKQQLQNDVVQHSFIICLYTSVCGSPFEISKKTNI